MINISYNALDVQPPDVVKEIAENINAVVRISHNEIRPRIHRILTLPISETDEKTAAQQIKAAYEQLTKKETITGAFDTAERIALYREDFVDRLREVFVHGGASYSALESIGAMRNAAREAMSDVSQPQVRPAEGGRAREEGNEKQDQKSVKYRMNEKHPARMHWPKWFTEYSVHKDTKDTWKAVGRKGLFAAGAAAGYATLTTAGGGSILGRIPGISIISNLANSATGWATQWGWGAKAALAFGPALATATTIGGGYIAGRLWEKFQRDVCGEKIPERSFTKRVWIGLTTPVRIPLYTLEKLMPPAAKWTWNKWKFARGLALGSIFAAAGLVTLPAAVAGGLAAGALSAASPGKNDNTGSSSPAGN